jgi:hypothetical protein
MLANALQENRSIDCPECGREVHESEQPKHLIGEHGYVDLAGILMPSAAARTCLWDRVFTTGDTRAHDRLCQLFASEAGPVGDRPSYVVALEAELGRRADALLAMKRAEFARLVRCLRQNGAARGQLWQLLRSADRRVRELGREFVLPEVSDASETGKATAADVQGLLDKLCPVDDINEKIRTCQRLTQLGVPPTAIAECLHRLRGERPIACPECSVAIPQDQVESHLRRVHRIYQFRVVRRPLEDTIATLFAAVCSPKPDHEAWDALESLARDEHGSRADAFLAAGVKQALRSIDDEKQMAALHAAAEVIAGSSSASGLTFALATSNEPASRQLALTIALLLPAPLASGLVTALQPLLTPNQAPCELQVAAAASLLRSTGKEGPAAVEIVNALVARGGKARAVDRLNQLEEQAGPSRIITERRAQIENQIRMRCPRCGVQLRRPQMAEHLWSDHSLLLDGRRVREPWRLVEDWISAYRQHENSELLVRCRALGQHLDPDHGLHRVYRLFLAAGIADVESRGALFAEARQRRASLCPRCFALVPLPEANMPRPLNRSHGRLSLGDYCVDVSESGLVPRLTIEGPGGLIFRGREPGRLGLTRHGATLLLAGPCMTAAVFYAALVNLLPVLPLWPVTIFLVLALAVYFGAGLYWWLQPRSLDRSVDFAWTRLVPRLGSESPHFPTSEESAFLAGVALTSVSHGSADARWQELERVLGIVERAVAAGISPLAHLAALQRLAVADAAAAGHDPVPLVVEQVSRCFDGRLPLAFVQWLLAEWEGSWWTAGNLARLRVLLCDRAFEAGWEVADLMEAGLMAPALEEVLRTADPNGLTQLRLLWSLRPSRPWAAWSEALTAFELAEDPEDGRAWLRKYPDLLFLDEALPAVVICGRGLVFQETVFTEWVRNIEIRARRDFDGVEYELTIGEHEFRFLSEPAGLVVRLAHWFRYHFGEFLPQVEGVRAWQAPEGSKSTQFQEAVACPECRRLLVPRAGQVGTPIGTATVQSS